MRDLSSLVISLFGAMEMTFGICYYLNECHAEFFWNKSGYCMLLYVLFFWVLRLKIQVGLLLLECMPCRIFLEQIWLLHVIVCAVFSGF